MKRMISAGLLISAATLALAQTAWAAPPDGSGPYADSVVDSLQGLRADGTPVLPERSNPTAALGVAENNSSDGTTFFSLGFGGRITLGFQNNICNAPGPDVALEISEATTDPYPPEFVDVYVSTNGVNYVLVADNAPVDAQIDLPDSINIARFVRLIDQSDPALFEPTADAYDVDAVRAVNTNCTGVGRMTGGGNHDVGLLGKVTHGFTLRCTGTPNNLTVTWKPVGIKKASTFKLTTLTSRLCSDDPALAPAPPSAPFDTFQGKGTGTVNNVAGYTIEFVFQDAGEPSTNDTSRIRITRTATSAVVLDLTTPLTGGNHQAH